MKMAIPEYSQNHFNFQSSCLAPPQRNKLPLEISEWDSPKPLPHKLSVPGGGPRQFQSSSQAGVLRGACTPSQHLPWGVGATSHGVAVGGPHPRVRVDGFVHGLLPQLHAKCIQLHCGGYAVYRKGTQRVVQLSQGTETI